MLIPLLFDDFVLKEALFSPENYGNLLSISQVTPGAVSINAATYVGYLQSGLMGAIIASIGLCFPTFILTSLILNVLHTYKNTQIVDVFLRGIKWASLLMIFYAIYLFAKISILKLDPFQINWLEFFVMVLCIILSQRISFTILLFLSVFIGLSVNYL